MSAIADYIAKLGQRDSIMLKGGIFFLFVFVVALMFPSGESIESDYHVGTIWTDKDLIAPFLFPIYKEEHDYQHERAVAAQNVYKVFEEELGVSHKNIDSLQKFFADLQSTLDARSAYLRLREAGGRKRQKNERELVLDSAALSNRMSRIPVSFTEDEWKTLQRLRFADAFAGKPRYQFYLGRLRRDVLLVVNELYLQGILNIRKESVGTGISIAFRRKTDEQIVPISKFLDADNLGRVVQQTFISGYKSENDTVSIATKIALSFLSPNIIFQKEHSDLEYFTSYLASLLNITLWQCSSSLLKHGLRNTYNLGLFKYYAYSLNRDPVHTQRTANLIDNSNCNLVYSHFGDAEKAPRLLDNFEWIRPYHQVFKTSVPCQHYVVAGLSETNANILNVLKKYPDSVVFMESSAEQYYNVYVKDIGNEDEYYCNLKNSLLFVCQGQSSFLADAFYNGKFSLVYPDYKDAESIINSQLSKKLGMGQIMSRTANLANYSELKVQPEYQSSIKYLHEKIKEIE